MTNISPASDFLFSHCNNQYQITLNPYIHYRDLVTNNMGKKLIDETLRRVQTGDFKDTIENWNFKLLRYGLDVSIGISDNLAVSGYSVRSGKPVKTSIVRLVGDGWILTYTGSLYKLGTKK